VESGRWRLEVPGIQRCRTTSANLLRLQEVAPKFHLDPLKLLLSLIALNDGELSLCGGYLRALGFGACGMIFDEHMLLYIGLFR
jgi:hypothetical protein